MGDYIIDEMNIRADILKEKGVREELCDILREVKPFITVPKALEEKYGSDCVSAYDYDELKSAVEEFEARYDDCSVLFGMMDKATNSDEVRILFSYISYYEDDLERERECLNAMGADVKVYYMGGGFCGAGHIEYAVDNGIPYSKYM